MHFCFFNSRVWQHVVCMGLDRNNIPDEYLCEVCKPRPVDRKKAKALQSRRRTEIFKDSSSSDNENMTMGGMLGSKVNRKKANRRIVDRNAEVKPGLLANLKAANLKKARKGLKIAPPEMRLKAKRRDSAGGKDPKKQYRKRKLSEKGGKRSNVLGKKIPGGRRKSLVIDQNEEDNDELFNDLEQANGGDSDSETLSPKLDASQHLRSWIDQYEEAVTNHYSPELRARLTGNKLNGISSDLRANVIGAPAKCNVSLKGNGVKV